MKAIGYVRVSTESQAEEGISIEAQSAKIRAWTELNNYPTPTILVDAGLSGKRSDNRPALQQAIQSATKGDALIVYSLSRLARSTKDTITIAEQLNRSGADLVSISEKIDTTNAAGKMVFRMLAVLAEFERDQVSERTKLALEHKRSLGQKTGGHTPFGFISINGQLSPDKHEQETIANMHSWHNAGFSLRAIANNLQANGIKTKNGKPSWSPETVAAILKRNVIK